MKPVSKFLGLNNVALPAQLEPGEMTAATDVDIGPRQELRARRGRGLLHLGAAHSPFQTPFGLLAVVDNDLLLFDAAGNVLRTVYDTLGYSRVWYVQLPDGRVGFSNGLISGLCTATTTSAWGFDAPPDAGTPVAGDTPYQITYVRLSDGLEGPATFGEPLDISQPITNLPMQIGFKINVYFAPYGGAPYLAGSTLGDSFVYTGTPWSLTVPSMDAGKVLGPLPVGRLMTQWRSRTLMAVGNQLWASRPYVPEFCDLTRDFIQLPNTITALYANDDGIFVGTTEQLMFLSGKEFSSLESTSIHPAPVVLGSVAEINPLLLNEQKRGAATEGAILIAGGVVGFIFGPGTLVPLTAGVYQTTVTEVYASTRLLDGALQYIAVPA